MRENVHLGQAPFAQTGSTKPEALFGGNECLRFGSQLRLFIWFLCFSQVFLHHHRSAVDSFFASKVTMKSREECWQCHCNATLH